MSSAYSSLSTTLSAPLIWPEHFQVEHLPSKLYLIEKSHYRNHEKHLWAWRKTSSWIVSVHVHILACFQFYRKWCRVLSIIMDPWKHAIVELPYLLLWTWLDSQTLPQFCKPITTDCVESFDEIDKGHVEVHILFLAFVFELPCCKDYVYCSSVIPIPHWLSDRRPVWSRCSFKRFSMSFVRIFSAIDNVMPLWLSQTWAFPFNLYRWIMGASLELLYPHAVK